MQRQAPDAGGGGRFAKVDTEAHPELADRYGIRAIPTLMAFRDGVAVFRQSGALPPDVLQAVVDRVRDLDPRTADEDASSTTR